jgi:hypothetical protein
MSDRRAASVFTVAYEASGGGAGRPGKAVISCGDNGLEIVAEPVTTEKWQPKTERRHRRPRYHLRAIICALSFEVGRENENT